MADVFAEFARAGSAYGVVQGFTGRKFPLRACGGVWAGQLRWGKWVLSNPAYSGVYACGQHRVVRTVRPDATVRTTSRALPRERRSTDLAVQRAQYDADLAERVFGQGPRRRCSMKWTHLCPAPFW